MRRILLTSVVTLMFATLVAGIATRQASAQPKGKTVTASGELVDMWCYLEDGSHGASHKGCATICANAGNPIGLLQSSGKIYLLVGSKDKQPPKSILAKYMGEQVTLKGILVTKGGISQLYVSSVKPMKGKR